MSKGGDQKKKEPNVDDTFRYSDYVTKALKSDTKTPDYLKAHLCFSLGISDRDDATATIRGMSFVESFLLAIISDNLEEAHLVSEDDFPLRERLRWARALGEITKEFADAVGQASRIRNKFAHKLSFVNIETDIPSAMVRALVEKTRPLTTGHLVDLAPIKGMSKTKWQVRMAIQVLVNELITLWWNPRKCEHARRVQPTGTVRGWDGIPPIRFSE